jgi:hypothetical protein
LSRSLVLLVEVLERFGVVAAEYVDKIMHALDVDALGDPAMVAVVEWVGILEQAASHPPDVDNLPTEPALQEFAADALAAYFTRLGEIVPEVIAALRQADAEARRFAVITNG